MSAIIPSVLFLDKDSYGMNHEVTLFKFVSDARADIGHRDLELNINVY
jgi:hypothetical protein